MSDGRERILERDAASGDFQAQAALTIEQLRSGTLPGLGPRETECRGYRPCEGADCGEFGHHHEPCGERARRCSCDGGKDWFTSARGSFWRKHEPCGGTGTLKDAECHAWEEGELACDSVRRVENRIACYPSRLSNWDPCSRCRGTGTLPHDPRDTVRLLAAWGCEASRLVAWSCAPSVCANCGYPHSESLSPRISQGCDEEWFCSEECEKVDEERGCAHEEVGDYRPRPLSVWTKGLLSLAVLLPPLRLVGGVECDICAGAKQPHKTYCCSGTGRKPYTVPMERWVAVRVGAAVGRVCFLSCFRNGNWISTYSHGDCEPIGLALNAAEAWTRCPCPGNERVWLAALDAPGAQHPDWIISPLTSNRLTSASDLIGEKAVRQAIRGARP